MKKEIIENIINVVNTLNSIEVKGKQNLLSLGGCIHILEGLVQGVQELNDSKEESSPSKEIEGE